MEEKQNDNIAVAERRTPASQISLQVMQHYQGPLPHPAVLADYEKIQPGLTERIVTLAEKEAEPRHKVDKILVKGAINADRWGQVFGFLVSIFAVAAGTYAAINGSPFAGAFIGAGGVAALASVFVLGQRADRKEEK